MNGVNSWNFQIVRCSLLLVGYVRMVRYYNYVLSIISLKTRLNLKNHYVGFQYCIFVRHLRYYWMLYLQNQNHIFYKVFFYLLNRIRYTCICNSSCNVLFKYQLLPLLSKYICLRLSCLTGYYNSGQKVYQPQQ